MRTIIKILFLALLVSCQSKKDEEEPVKAPTLYEYCLAYCRCINPKSLTAEELRRRDQSFKDYCEKAVERPQPLQWDEMYKHSVKEGECYNITL